METTCIITASMDGVIYKALLIIRNVGGKRGGAIAHGNVKMTECYRRCAGYDEYAGAGVAEYAD
jgi:hypothetical protein